jgi:uncharacterized protein (DUF1697 family)
MGGRHVALIRGINVGRAKRVSMADLRDLVGELGYVNVSTLLNSGNVLFTMARGSSSGAAGRIERALLTRLAIAARVVVLSAADVAAIVRENPLGRVAHDPSHLLVTVLTDPADRPQLMPLSQRTWTPEALAIGSRAAYIWCPAGIIKSPAIAAVNRVVGDRATSRNWTTMTKLHALAEATVR